MELICLVIQLYIFVIIAGALMSWFPTQPGGGMAQIRDFLAKLTDPVMLPVRRAVGASMGGIDFSPIIVIIGLSLIQGIIC